jgi:hypothetical protein
VPRVRDVEGRAGAIRQDASLGDRTTGVLADAG